MKHQWLSTRYNLETMGFMVDISFGDWVRGNRRRLGWSQARLARETGMDASHISKIENEVIGLPEVETRERFHAVFGTTEDQLTDLGLVPKYDEWGRRVDVTVQGETAETRAHALGGTSSGSGSASGSLTVRPGTATATGQGLPPTVIATNEHSPSYDADAPLTPEEEAEFARLIFLGYSKMTNAERRILLETTRRIIHENR